MPGSAWRTTSPPLPPSPPAGPPCGAYFSRRNATHPFPPCPATMRISQLSTKRTAGRYHGAVRSLLLPLVVVFAGVGALVVAAGCAHSSCFPDDIPDKDNVDQNCDRVDGNVAAGIF